MASTWNQVASYSALSQNHQCKYGMDFFHAHLSKGQNVLDIGCGTGDLTSNIMEVIHPGYILAVDPDEERIKFAKEKYSTFPGIEFVTCKASEIPINGRDDFFDLAVSNATIHWMDAEEKKLCLENVYRFLKPGGFFLVILASGVPHNVKELVSFMKTEDVRKPSRVSYVVTNTEFSDLCSNVGFDVVSSDEAVHETAFESLEGLCEFYYASSSGVIDFKKAVDKANRHYGGKCPITWEGDKENCSISHLYRFALRK